MATDNKMLAILERQNQFLEAILTVLVRGSQDPAEVLLAEAGFGPLEIGRLIGKKPDAVRMLVKRYNQQKNNK